MSEENRAGQLNLLSQPVEMPTPTYGVDGSYVSVEERAKLLITTLDSFSARNQRKGFALSAFTSPASKEIWSRYEEETEGVLKGARRNRFLFEAMAKQSFWRATGFRALKYTGLIRPRQVDPRGEKMWDDFYYQYSHPKTHKARIAYKKQLEQFIPPGEPIEQSEPDQLAA
jgi:hypothetical protein